MRILILSVSAGGGHKHAAEAMKKYIEMNEPSSEVMIIDTLKYINPIIDKVVIGSYLKTIKITPSLFGKLYEHTEYDDSIASISSKVIELLTSKLLPLIEEFKPDALISTHPFSTEMMSIMKVKHKPYLPMISIITDYTSHSFWLHPHIDAYVVSNEKMVEDMVSKGIEKNTIFNYGIPVNPSFLNKFNREDTLKELSFDKNIPTILVMGGSLGIGKITEIYEELIKIEKEIQIIVLSGSNEKLYNDLVELSYDSPKKTAIFGYTYDVNKYMQCSDLLITKPGGITITEAFICNSPMALFSPIPGQEERNAEFLVENKLAIDLYTTENYKVDVENVLNNPDFLNNIKINYKTFAKPNSGQNIYNLILKLINNTAKFDDNFIVEKNNSKSTLSNIKDFFKLMEKSFLAIKKSFANN